MSNLTQDELMSKLFTGVFHGLHESSVAERVDLQAMQGDTERG